MNQRENIHATAITIDSHGILIRGVSGSGKSLLALYLLDLYGARGREVALVADDRVDLEHHDDHVILSPPKTIAGLIELRGRGIIRRPSVEAVHLALVVDLVPELIRMPDDTAFSTSIFGIPVPRCPVPQAGIIALEHQRLLIEAALDAISLGSGA
ncbi:serine/threonine protein kinase [Devosia sp. BK]|uniref:HPr kinase/phosphorylase n=1 Tax=unclassified Devosia TaxID=196773 RepID=UPI0007151B97|nr:MULTISPECIES: hypothetical protein [unclassified Devosia]KQN78383.1 hypothetical protein ASE94_15520 [Devosia sp. Leaf64]MDV3253429.1 serine/threonine protein kinase [Devosia sp. BK]